MAVILTPTQFDTCSQFKPPMAVDGYGAIYPASTLQWYRDQWGSTYFACRLEQYVVWECEKRFVQDPTPVTFRAHRCFDRQLIEVPVANFFPCYFYLGIRGHHIALY